MKAALEIIQQKAKELQKLEQSEQLLFEHLNRLSVAEVESLIADLNIVSTGSAKKVLLPVNLLRRDILQKITDGVPLTSEVIEEIQNRIVQKDGDYFSHYGPEIVAALQKYPQKKKSPFVNWKKKFYICFPFLYPESVKREVAAALHTIVEGIDAVLQTPQYKSYFIDFEGPQNYGASNCWIAEFPKSKVSHKNAYQLFIQIHAEKIEAGILAGWNIEDNSVNSLEDYSTIDEAIDKLKASKALVDKKNSALVNYWKFAPGENGIYWDEFYSQGIMAIGWESIQDASKYTTEQLAAALDVDDEGRSNQINNIENFRDASIGDIIIANKGKSKALGIGVIDGEYGYDPTQAGYKHIRKVRWLINEQVDFNKSIFRPDTFSPTLKWESIKTKYIETNPSNAKIIEELEAGKDIPVPPKVRPKDPENLNYWWLNANPKIWKIEDCELGDLQSYTSYNDKGNKRRIYKYFESVKIGDLVIGYASSPVKQIKGIFEITESLHVDESKGEIISFEVKELVNDVFTWDELKETKGLDKCEIFSNNQGSLFKLQPEEFDIIRDIIDEKNILAEKEKKRGDIIEYSYSNDPEKPFFDDEVISEILQSLEVKKNIVLQGPPGVGKTFIAKKIAYEFLKRTDETKIRMVQFHQSYSYEDFIQGIRPSEKSFRVKNGIFYDFCKKAAADPRNNYIFIIDEINRGNLSKIFGELMMLIESDKRGTYSIPLTYSERDDPSFSVPPNLYIIGTMNTADRSLAIVDYALRRRFRFITIRPQFNSRFIDFLTKKGVSKGFVQDIVSKISTLNEKITADKNLGEGFVIGHSYFCNRITGDEQSWFKNIVKFEISPLLEEYWFDALDKAAVEVNALLSQR